ncbi:hypothetical protein O181_084161 [Austropuccinia psidii MF-1]|uniref:CCHC-type domain-containing protein n=1 Tax=Austropuccinia psidii MF-1 TaxID=1389203 RepID=A0A9Q3FVZ2_9BASI|nr:hypothetical protein [Austropuccinia psidii MF-1]
MAEVTKKKNSCHNCGSTDHYSSRCPKATKKNYAIEKFPEQELQEEDYELEFMCYFIRENSDNDQEPIEEFLVEYQEETRLEIQEIKLE